MESCVKWVQERSLKNGFTIHQVRADGYRQVRFKKVKGGSLVQYSTVDFTGLLEIVDDNLFKTMLFRGVGPEKGFGCGLMLVRKV